MELNEKSFSTGLKKLFKETGLSQGEIARRSGLERSYVSRLLKGDIVYPRLNMVHRLAKAFGFTATELVDYIIKNQDGDGRG